MFTKFKNSPNYYDAARYVLISAHAVATTPDVIKLKRENDRLAVALLRMREQLQKQERYAAGLEIVLRERLGRIDHLNGKLEQLREQNKRLDQENEHLAEMIRFAPPVESRM